MDIKIVKCALLNIEYRIWNIECRIKNTQNGNCLLLTSPTLKLRTTSNCLLRLLTED